MKKEKKKNQNKIQKIAGEKHRKIYSQDNIYTEKK